MARRRMKELTSGRHKKIRIAPLSLALVILTVFVIVFLSLTLPDLAKKSRYFQIHRIDSDVSISPTLEKRIKEMTLFDIDLQNIYQLVLRDHPEYKHVIIYKIFPSTLKIGVIKRIPYAQIKHDGFYVIDKEGMILDHAANHPFPGLFIVELGEYPASLKKGSYLRDKRFDCVISLISELNRSNLLQDYHVETINASTIDSIFFVLEGVNIIVGKGDFEKKIFFLKNLLKEKFPSDLSIIQYVDLRYASHEKNIYIGNRR
jgi:cell division septal protein FtsQ